MEINKKTCPICGKDNNCGHQQGLPHGNCWCDTIEVPKELIEQIPNELKGKACICQACVLEFKKKNIT